MPALVVEKVRKEAGAQLAKKWLESSEVDGLTSQMEMSRRRLTDNCKWRE